jgi:hypothetical protein
METVTTYKTYPDTHGRSSTPSECQIQFETVDVMRV